MPSEAGWPRTAFGFRVCSRRKWRTQSSRCFDQKTDWTATFFFVSPSERPGVGPRHPSSCVSNTSDRCADTREASLAARSAVQPEFHQKPPRKPKMLVLRSCNTEKLKLTRAIQYLTFTIIKPFPKDLFLAVETKILEEKCTAR